MIKAVRRVWNASVFSHREGHWARWRELAFVGAEASSQASETPSKRAIPPTPAWNMACTLRSCKELQHRKEDHMKTHKYYALAGVLLTSGFVKAADAPESEQVSKLLSETKTLAFQVKEDA